MTDSELNRLLKTAAVPQQPPAYWDHFAKKVMGLARARASRPQPDGEGSPDSPVRAPAIPRLRSAAVPLWLWPARLAAGLALALALIGLGLGIWKQHASPAADPQYAAIRRCFQEVAALFPNQLQTIVFDARETHLILAEQPNVPVSQPLYVKIDGPTGCRRFVTFSGQQIRFNDELCDVLLDGGGHVLLVGRQLVWSSAQPGRSTGGYQIEAKLLAAS